MSPRHGIPKPAHAESPAEDGIATLVDRLLEDQRRLTAVERFSQRHGSGALPAQAGYYKDLIPLSAPRPGEQYAFEVDLDACSGCKGCVTACHSLNGLDDNETWREVGFLVGTERRPAGPFSPGPGDTLIPLTQVVTTACHHCADPGCMNGCPVLAYDKDPATGIVRHLDDQCIGCSYCIMKCPYEVPKYSKSRGIVRKCDLCQGRLAEGEAPACVQACPNEAIRITVVLTAGVLAGHRGGSPGFLPDSPDPSITAPSTRYVTRHAGASLLAADHAVPRLDSPHWPLVAMLVMTQAAAGLALAAPFLASFPDGTPARAAVTAGGGLLAAGLAASVLHLGQPLKAWRAFLGWRRSWLSREIIAFNAFAGATAAGAAAVWIPALQPFRLPALVGAAVAGLAGVLASAMVYIDTRRPAWAASYTVVHFLGTTLLLGATLSAPLLAWFEPGASGALRPALVVATLAAVLARAALFAWNRLAFRAAIADPGSEVHLNARALDTLIPWVRPLQFRLFLVATAAGLLAVVGGTGSPVAWAGLAALATVASEVVGRFAFFAAGAARKMPGGIRP